MTGLNDTALNGVSSWCSRTLENRERCFVRELTFREGAFTAGNCEKHGRWPNYSHAVVQRRSRVQLTCGPVDCSAPGSLSFTVSWGLLRFTSVESVMLFSHLILGCPSPFAFSTTWAVWSWNSTAVGVLRSLTIKIIGKNFFELLTCQSVFATQMANRTVEVTFYLVTSKALIGLRQGPTPSIACSSLTLQGPRLGTCQTLRKGLSECMHN